MGATRKGASGDMSAITVTAALVKVIPKKSRMNDERWITRLIACMARIAEAASIVPSALMVKVENAECRLAIRPHPIAENQRSAVIGGEALEERRAATEIVAWKEGPFPRASGWGLRGAKPVPVCLADSDGEATA
jgi:hypothetical protein